MTTLRNAPRINVIDVESPFFAGVSAGLDDLMEAPSQPGHQLRFARASESPDAGQANRPNTMETPLQFGGWSMRPQAIDALPAEFLQTPPTKGTRLDEGQPTTVLTPRASPSSLPDASSTLNDRPTPIRGMGATPSRSLLTPKAVGQTGAFGASPSKP